MAAVRKTTSDPVNDAAAAVLRAVLAEEDVKHAAVAREMGVDPAQLSKWLKGTKGQVTVKLILAVAKVANVEAGTILDRIGVRAKASGERLEDPSEGFDL